MQMGGLEKLTKEVEKETFSFRTFSFSVEIAYKKGQ